MSDRRHQTHTTADERDALVRELHHRVKNNLQIIVSLMNVQKRMLPPERRSEIRFLEEHVQAIAAAYRVVYASGEMIKVSIDELIREVVSGLVEVAGGKADGVETADCKAHMMINLDQAITLGALSRRHLAAHARRCLCGWWRGAAFDALRGGPCLP